MLEAHQQALLELLLEREALRFGDFTLKSGRKSPYFINAGCFHHGADIAKLGSAYAGVIQSQIAGEIDVVFGPAYKGIPLALAAAQELEKATGRAIGWTYDRKEVKDHGDGGMFVGAPLKEGTRVVVVDDVLTAGTALRETLAKLKPLGVEVVAAIVAVDRQERGQGSAFASEEIAKDHGVPLHPVLSIGTIVEHLESTGDSRLPADAAETIRAHLKG